MISLVNLAFLIHGVYKLRQHDLSSRGNVGGQGDQDVLKMRDELGGGVVVMMMSSWKHKKAIWHDTIRLMMCQCFRRKKKQQKLHHRLISPLETHKISDITISRVIKSEESFNGKPISLMKA